MCRGRKLVTFFQLTLNGLAVGCIYGLVALGFVLIYKATELVNFAQGDLMMLGAFVCLHVVVWWGLDYWLAFAASRWSPSASSAPLLDADGAAARHRPAAVRRGHADHRPRRHVPQLRLDHLGLGDLHAADPVQRQGDTVGGVTRQPRVRVDHRRHACSCARVLYAFFTYTRVGVAMQAASQNQLAAYYMGIPVKRMFSLIWAISAGVAAIAGILLAPVSLIDINMGFIGAEGLRGRGAGRLRLASRARWSAASSSA